MNTVLSDMEALELIIHNLNKVDSKMQVGRFFDARRELMRVITALEKNKKDLMAYIAGQLNQVDEAVANEDIHNEK